MMMMVVLMMVLMMMIMLLTELTQDVASRGLGVVYESCDAEQKQNLVTALVDTLMTGKRSLLRSLCLPAL